MPDTPYFTVEEFKTRYASDQKIQALEDAPIDEAREEAEETIEGLQDTDDTGGGCHIAFVPRTETFKFSGDGSRGLAIPRYLVRSVESCSVGGAEVDAAGITIEGSTLFRSIWTRGFSNVEVTVVHGMDAPPRRIRKAAMILTHDLLVSGPITERATGRITPEGSVITLVMPGRGGAVTGIPEVDTAIGRYRRPVIRSMSMSLGDRGRDYPALPTL